MKSGNLNFLEPSGPLSVCNGTALPFFLAVYEEKAQGKEKVTLEDQNGDNTCYT